MHRQIQTILTTTLALAVFLSACSPQATPAVLTTPTQAAYPAATQVGEANQNGYPVQQATAVPTAQANGDSEMISDKPRITDPQVDAETMQALAKANTALAMNLYQALREKDANIFFSPYSIYLALAMTSAGASDATLQQLLNVLDWQLTPADLHAAVNALDQQLQAAPSEEGGLQLTIANSLWGQSGYPFTQSFLDTLAQYYGSGLQTVDFADADPVRQTINQWVADQTHNKIQDLFPQGSITAATRLVLANAIYFKAAWMHQFTAEQTQDGDFTLTDGSTKTVPMMHQTDSFGYFAGQGYQAVNLPYSDGSTSMLILMPAAGSLDQFESNLTADVLQKTIDGLSTAEVRLSMPRFKIESSFDLGSTLTQLGMDAAFDPQKADFSAMDGSHDLSISSVVHKAYVNVDEEGTEAAAATGVIVGVTSMPMQEIVELNLDHPFVFFIMDNLNGAVLFMGRVANP